MSAIILAYGNGGATGDALGPVFMVFVIGAVAVGWLVKGASFLSDASSQEDYGARSYEDNEWSPPVRPEPPREPGLTGMEAIMASDPSFNQETFLDGVEAVFMVIQRGWVARDLDTVRPHLSQGMLESMKARMDRAVASGKRLVVEDLRITGIAVDGATHDPSFDSIAVRINASALESTVDENNGTASEKSNTEFGERWTLTRPAGARTSADATPGKCPNCGAPLALDPEGACKFCGATEAAGGFGWVLARLEHVDTFSGEIVGSV